MRCPSCNSKDCYIVRIRNGETLKEQWTCSACFWEDKQGNYDNKGNKVVQPVIVPNSEVTNV